jgi:hypothetical protein
VLRANLQKRGTIPKHRLVAPEFHRSLIPIVPAAEESKRIAFLPVQREPGMIAGAQGAPRASEMGRGIGGLVTGIAAGLMEAAVRKERARRQPRSGQPVWRNSYNEGQLEDRLWRPIGIGKARGPGAAPSVCLVR